MASHLSNALGAITQTGLKLCQAVAEPHRITSLSHLSPWTVTEQRKSVWLAQAWS